ncbi:metallophosphoesterase family protein [Luteolibacter sp. AS25]|uniref:metallophosphoesterase family protein n=1 Tax=Luteolibacter sp. AS25 TaxID=3135776 RepID=UPI00398B3FDB
MSRHRLGNFSEPVLLFGGAYGNLQSTIALRRIAEDASIPPDRVICTGDLTAYCAEPWETVELIRGWGIHCISGNVETQLATKENDCGCNFAPDTSCDRLSQHWFKFTDQEITDDQRKWFQGLPGHLLFNLNGFSCAVVHGSFREANRFIFESTPWGEKAAELETAEASVMICGHSGLPFCQTTDGKLWCNAGVIGMPANDGTPRAWYAILEPLGKDGLRCTLHPFDYDHETASDRMWEKSLPAEYRNSLVSGLWHSCDILPGEETLGQGRALAGSAVELFRSE